MERACDKAALAGLGVSVVVHSNHFGAAGVYSTIAAERGLIGFACTGTTQRSVVPTGAREPRFSTNPIAFAASPAEGEPFSLDMATSTVAVGKVNIARRAGRPLAGRLGRAPGRPARDRCGRRLQCKAEAPDAARRQPHARQPQGLRPGR